MVNGPTLLSQRILGADPEALQDAKKVMVSGILPLTTIDYPSKLSAVFFTQGCSWKCPYCQNPELLPFKSGNPEVAFDKIQNFLEERKGLLDGIVFSGGEPTEQKHLASLMQYVKGFEFEIALHTNGAHPEMLQKLLPLCDFVAMDIKAPFKKYDEISKIEGSGAKARKSAEIIVNSGISYEFRTTYHPNLLSEDELLEAAGDLKKLDAKHFVIQAFLKKGCPNEELNKAPIPENVISDELKQKIKALIPDFKIRN